MPKHNYRHFGTPSVLPLGASQDQIKGEFARRLQAAMTEKGLMQSELAMRAATFMADKKFGRDLISFYVRAKSLPSPTHLRALCRALGKEPTELLPFHGVPGGDNATTASFEVKDAGDGQNAWVLMNRQMSWKKVRAILDIVHSPEAELFGEAAP